MADLYLQSLLDSHPKPPLGSTIVEKYLPTSAGHSQRFLQAVGYSRVQSFYVPGFPLYDECRDKVRELLATVDWSLVEIPTADWNAYHWWASSTYQTAGLDQPEPVRRFVEQLLNGEPDHG